MATLASEPETKRLPACAMVGREAILADPRQVCVCMYMYVYVYVSSPTPGRYAYACT